MKSVPRIMRNWARAVALLAALAIGLVSGHSGANTSDFSTEVQCPALSADVRAEFEARAQVDLSLRLASGGQLEVVCNGLAAHVSFRPRAGKRFERDVAPASDPAALVDALLVAVAELAADAAHEEVPAPEQPEKAATQTGTPRTEARRDVERSSENPARAPGAVAPERGGMLWPPPLALGLGGDFALLHLSGMGLGTADVTLVAGLPQRMVVGLGGRGDGQHHGKRSPAVRIVAVPWFSRGGCASALRVRNGRLAIFCRPGASHVRLAHHG